MYGLVGGRNVDKKEQIMDYICDIAGGMIVFGVIFLAMCI
jgi:hypothetical protein